MPNTKTIERLRGLVLSADDIKILSTWPDPLMEDYLNIYDNLVTIAKVIDALKIEEIDTDFTDGSIPFADSELLVEDSDLFWDNTNKRLGIGTNTPAATLDIDGTVNLPATGISGAGSGSGLDADKLDDHDSLYFATQAGLTALTAVVTALSLVVDGLVAWKATGWSGSFTNADGDTVTVVDGLITGVA